MIRNNPRSDWGTKGRCAERFQEMENAGNGINVENGMRIQEQENEMRADHPLEIETISDEATSKRQKPVIKTKRRAGASSLRKVVDSG